LKTAYGPTRCRGQQHQTFAHRPTLLAHDCSGESQCCNTRREPQPRTVGIADEQRCTQERSIDIDPDRAQKTQRVNIGANQDVLAVVERQAADTNSASPSAELGSHFEKRDGMAALHSSYSCSETGPACSDNRNSLRCRHQRPRQFVRIAIHSLRKGVSEVRWCNT